MKALVVFVLALVAIAHAQLRLRPEHMKEHFDQWDREEKYVSSPIGSRIIGGSQTASGGRPFQILLARSGSFTCGGSLISSTKVLTAAHCVYGNENSPTSFSVRYNTLTQTGGQSITVSRITRHGSYSSSTIDYDVAVLTLASAFTPGTNAATVAIATSEPSSGTVVASGWGRTSGGGSVSSTLKQANLNYVSRTSCQSTMGSINTITARMICATHASNGVCNGDSGGPLTYNGQQIGVNSWVVGSCLTGSYPNVFANAVNLRSWIVAQ